MKFEKKEEQRTYIPQIETTHVIKKILIQNTDRGSRSNENNFITKTHKTEKSKRFFHNKLNHGKELSPVRKTLIDHKSIQSDEEMSKIDQMDSNFIASGEKYLKTTHNAREPYEKKIDFDDYKRPTYLSLDRPSKTDKNSSTDLYRIQFDSKSVTPKEKLIFIQYNTKNENKNIYKKTGRFINKNVKIIGVAPDPSRKKFNIKKNKYMNQTTLKQKETRPAQSHSPKKFQKITLAFLATKGPNCEDRIFSRGMRTVKGGVVDLYQSNPNHSPLKKNNNNVLIKKFSKKNLADNPKIRKNVKDREKSVKTIQHWWRDILNKFKVLNNAVKLIQKNWRGYNIRSNFEEFCYFRDITSFLIQKIKLLARPQISESFDILRDNFAINYKNRMRNNSAVIIQSSFRKKIAMKIPKKLRIEKILNEIKNQNNKEVINELKKFLVGISVRKRKCVAFLDLIKFNFRKQLFQFIRNKLMNVPLNNVKQKYFEKIISKKILSNEYFLIKYYFDKWWKLSFVSSKKQINIGLLLLIKKFQGETFNFLKKLQLKNHSLHKFIGFFKRFNTNNEVKYFLQKWNKNAFSNKFLMLKTVFLNDKIKNFQKVMLNSKGRNYFNHWVKLTLKLRNLNPFVSGLNKLCKTFKKHAFKNSIELISNFKEPHKERLLIFLTNKRNEKENFQLKNYLKLWASKNIRIKLKFPLDIIKGEIKLLKFFRKISFPSIYNKLYENWYEIKMKENLENLINKFNLCRENNNKFALYRVRQAEKRFLRRKQILNELVDEYQSKLFNLKKSKQRNYLKLWSCKANELKEKFNRDLTNGIKKINFTKLYFDYVINKIRSYVPQIKSEFMLLRKAFPQIVKFRTKKLLNAFAHWKSLNIKSKIFELDCRIIEKIAFRKILKLNELSLLKYFRKWIFINHEIKNKFLKALLKVETFSKKYAFSRFDPIIKKQSSIKLIRFSLLKKMQNEWKDIKVLFDLWNLQANKMKMKSERYLMVTKFVIGIKKRNQKYNDKSTQSLYLRKWNQTQKMIKDKFTSDTINLVKNVQFFIKRNYFKTTKNALKENYKNSKFYGLFNLIDDKYKKIENLNLISKFQFYFKQINNEKIKDLKMKILLGKLKTNLQRIHHKILNSKFQKFKKQKYNPNILNELRKISNIFMKKMFNNLNKKTMFLNQSIPNNESNMSILLRGGRNKARLNIFPKIFKGIFFRKWKEIKNQNKKKMFSAKIISKRISELINNEKLKLGRILLMWKLKINEIQNRKNQDSIISRIIKNFSLYIDEKRLKRFLLFWKSKCNKAQIKENNIELGILSVKKFSLFNFFKNMRKNYIRVIEDNKDLKNSKILIFSYLVSKKKQLLFLNISKWKKQIENLRNKELRYMILKNVLVNQNTAKIRFSIRRLLENLLMWRYKAFPNILYKYNLLRIKGEIHTNNTLRLHLNNYVFDKIKYKSNYLKFRQKVKNVTKRITKNLEDIILKKRLLQWKDRLGDKNRTKEKLQLWFNKYFDLLNSQKENINGPLSELKNAAKNICKRKGEMAARILDTFKTKLAKKKVTKLRSKRDTTKNTFTKTSELLKRKLCSYLSFWKIQSIKLKLHIGAQKIQRKFREYRNRKNLLKKKIDKISNSFNKGFKNKAFKNIKSTSKHSRLSELMQKIIKDIPYEVRFKFYSKYLRLWLVRSKELENEEREKKMKKILKSKKKENELKISQLKNEKAMNMFSNYASKLLQKSEIYFRKWKNCDSRQKIIRSGKIIKKFLQFSNKLIKKDRIKQLCKKYIRNQIVNIAKKIRTKPINRERDFCLTFENLTNKNFRDFISKLKKSNFRKIMSKSINNLNHKKNNDSLRHYLRFWQIYHLKSRDKLVKKSQGLIKAHFVRKAYNELKNKNQFLKKSLQKVKNQLLQKMLFAFKKWFKNSKQLLYNDKAIKIQSLYLMNKAFKKRSILHYHKWIYNLGNKKNRKDQINILSELKKLRKLKIEVLSRIEKDEMSIKKKSFMKIQKVGNFQELFCKKFQEKYRFYIANKKKKHLIKWKKTLENLYNSYLFKECQGFRKYFSLWKNTSNVLNLNDKANVIQNFMFKHILNYKLRKFKGVILNLFSRKLKILPQIVKKSASFVKFLHSILKVLTLRRSLSNYKTLNLLQENNRILKIKGCITRYLISSQIKTDIDKIKNSFKLWKIHWNKNSNRKYYLIVKIQNFYKKLKQNKETRWPSQIRKEGKVLLILKNLVKIYQVKVEQLFYKWKREIGNEILESSARILQNYLLKCIERKRILLNIPEEIARREGFRKLGGILNVCGKRYPFEKIRNEAKRRSLIQFVLNLKNKKNNYIQIFLDNLRKVSEVRKVKMNDIVIKVQKNWRKSLVKKRIKTFILKIKYLRYLFYHKLMEKLETYAIYLRRWGNISQKMKEFKNSEKIKTIITKRLTKRKKEKQNQAKNGIKKIFREYLILKKLKPCFKDIVIAKKVFFFINLIRNSVFRKESNISVKGRKNILKKYSFTNEFENKVFRNFCERILSSFFVKLDRSQNEKFNPYLLVESINLILKKSQEKEKKKEITLKSSSSINNSKVTPPSSELDPNFWDYQNWSK